MNPQWVTTLFKWLLVLPEGWGKLCAGKAREYLPLGRGGGVRGDVRTSSHLARPFVEPNTPGLGFCRW